MLRNNQFRKSSLLVCLCVFGLSPALADSPKPKAVAAASPQQKDTPQRAQQARIVGQRGGQSYYANMVPRDVDRSQGRERILLFLTQTPLLIEFEIRVDGQPFRELRETLIDEMLDGIPTDDEGKATWDEAIKAPKFARGRRFSYGQQAQRVNQVVGRFDLNRDGFVDRYETRHYLALQFGGPAFLPTNRVTSMAVSIESAIKKLLDDDGDGQLSNPEIDAASERLLARDLNDDEVVEASELIGGLTRGYQPVRSSPATAAFVHLCEKTDWSQLIKQLHTRYGQGPLLTANAFGESTRLSQRLELSGEARVDRTAIERLLKIEPDIRLAANPGAAGPDENSGFSVAYAAQHIDEVADIKSRTDGELEIELPTISISLVHQNQLRMANYDATVAALMTRNDTDKNGYMDKAEFLKASGNRNAAYVQSQFTTWDSNGDGKVFADELKKFYDEMQRPQRSQVSLAAIEGRGSIFATLDENKDGRLGVRELAYTSERLRVLDKDGDGIVGDTEIPSTVKVALARGSYASQLIAGRGYAFNRFGSRMTTRAPQVGVVAGPTWFFRMDRNGDGDITPREFLGTRAQFDDIDTDGDGFINLAEANNVEKSGKNEE